MPNLYVRTYLSTPEALRIGSNTAGRERIEIPDDALRELSPEERKALEPYTTTERFESVDQMSAALPLERLYLQEPPSWDAVVRKIRQKRIEAEERAAQEVKEKADKLEEILAIDPSTITPKNAIDVGLGMFLGPLTTADMIATRLLRDSTEEHVEDARLREWLKEVRRYGLAARAEDLKRAVEVVRNDLSNWVEAPGGIAPSSNAPVIYSSDAGPWFPNGVQFYHVQPLISPWYEEAVARRAAEKEAEKQRRADREALRVKALLNYVGQFNDDVRYGADAGYDQTKLAESIFVQDLCSALQLKDAMSPFDNQGLEGLMVADDVTAYAVRKHRTLCQNVDARQAEWPEGCVLEVGKLSWLLIDRSYKKTHLFIPVVVTHYDKKWCICVPVGKAPEAGSQSGLEVGAGDE